MKCFISSFVFFFSVLGFAGVRETTYNLKWDHGKLPLEIKMYEGAPSLSYRVAETGEFKDRSQLPIMNDLKENKIAAKPGETKILILVVKNNSDEPLHFAVAPHGVSPTEASLGIKFTCLCNGHTYTVAPHKMWYRIMALKTFKAVDALKTEVVLEHKIFPVTDKSQAHQAHNH